MKIKTLETAGFAPAITAMRNPLDSWERSDSVKTEQGGFILGEKDEELSQRLTKAGSEHCKHLRMIHAWADLVLPRYVWSEMDTYIFNTKISCSTMHKAWQRPLTLHDFEHGIDLSVYENNEFKEVEIDNIKEIWRDIEGYEGLYKISNKGYIYKYPHKTIDSNGFERTYNGKILNQSINSSNYKKVVLIKNKEKKNYYVHRLLANAFIDNPKNLSEVNHIDGNKINNNISNLEWVTKSENSKHAFDNGLRNISDYNRFKVANSGRVLTKEDASEIRNRYSNGESISKIHKDYDCSYTVISNIVSGKTYNDISLCDYDKWKLTIDELNNIRQLYVETKDLEYFYQFKRKLPEGFLQKRTIDFNYAELLNIYNQRKNHKLKEWHTICDWIEELPLFKELTGI